MRIGRQLHRRTHLLGRVLESRAEEGDDARVDVAAARAHHQALKRRQPHGRVYALSLVDCRHARSAAEVADDGTHLVLLHSEQVRSLQQDARA